MATATIATNLRHDACAIFWDRRPNDFPIPAINQALYLVCKENNNTPFLYEVYDGDTVLGILVTGNFNPENDAELRAVFHQTIDEGKAIPLSDEFGPKTVQV